MDRRVENEIGPLGHCVKDCIKQANQLFVPRKTISKNNKQQTHHPTGSSWKSGHVVCCDHVRQTGIRKVLIQKYRNLCTRRARGQFVSKNEKCSQDDDGIFPSFDKFCKDTGEPMQHVIHTNRTSQVKVSF